ncbi:MAG TPA: hypothetical protein PKZ08_10850, partial [Vicinamibacterales bacterium]|nr:hypothetical protein [Vicinamibacterales bacterium]
MGLVVGIGTARQGVQTRSVRGRAGLADFTAAALRREAFILSDNPYAGRGDSESVGQSWTVAAEILDGYRADWAEGGQAALDKRADLTPEQAAVLGQVFEGEREGREAGEFILGRNLSARADADASGAVYQELDAERVRGIVTEAGADAEARLAEMGFTEAGAARVAGYVRKEAALGNRFARVLGDIRESLARDLEADPERAGAQAGAVRRMLEIQPLREVYQRAGTRQGAVKAFKELRFTQEQAENLAAAFDEERAFAASPEAAAAWRAAYLDASREATPGERLRRMTGFEARPAPEAGEGASLLTLRGPDGKPRGEILLQPDTAETFDPESRFAGEAVEQASAGKPWAVTERQWQAFTPEQRRAYAAEYIRPRGGFTVTDPADPSVSADGAQADILTGRITLAPDAPSATIYHEAAHAWLAVLRRGGKLSAADVAKLRDAYGPSAADPQWFNEEALADDIREIGAETDYTPDKPLARRFIDAVRRLAGAARAEESRRTAASGARQALYESIVYGAPFEGVGDFAAVPKAADTAGESKASADPIAGASTAQAATGDGQQETGDKQPETRNQKPETRNPEPETKNQKPEAGRWTAATPQGNLRVGGHWVIAPRDRFISDTDPRYDFSLQNRSRDAALGSSEQVAEIVAKFDALRLLDSPDTANGAPLAVPVTLKGADGKNETFYMVLSGNGRFRALDQLDAAHRGDEYRNPVKAFADERGIPYDPADMTEAAKPRLVRVLTRMPAGATRQRIAELSNQNAVLQMTDAERAYSDAALVERDGTADLYAANKDGMPSRNGSDAFFAWFVRAAGDASLMDSQGRPTDAARARARRAMLALAIGRGRRGKETVMAFTEQAEALGLDRQRDALLMSAGALSALGEAKPDYALADEMSRAAADLLMLARERKAGKAVTVNEFIAQGDMLDAMPPAAGEALKILDSGRPAEGIAAAFQRYADLASKIDTDTADMFGEAPAAKEELLRKAFSDTDVKAPAGPRYSIALAARRYALATGMPAEGERLMARQLEFLFARHMDPAYIASRARAAETRRANAAAAERAKAVARRDAHGRALANPDDPQAWAEAFAASEDGTVSRIAHDFFMGGDGPQRFPHAYGGKPLYGTRVNTPRDAAALLMPLRNPYQESFKAIFLDDKRRVLGAEVCTLGLLDSAPVHPR